MRKLTTLLCLGVVLYAVPALADRSTERQRKPVRTLDKATKVEMGALHGQVAYVPGTVYSNMSGPYYSIGPLTGYVGQDDYDSINDEDIDCVEVGFVGGVVNAGDALIVEFWDATNTTFINSIGYLLPAGNYIWGFYPDHYTIPDQGWVRVYGYPVAADGSGHWFINNVGPSIGSETPGVGGYTYVYDYYGTLYYYYYAQTFELKNPEIMGVCCIALTGACSIVPEAECPGTWTENPEGTCDPNPCPPGTCGNGDIDEGEECDDGNTTPGDGCDALCQNEATFIPAVSEWGLLVMLLLGLTVGTVLFGRRRHATA